MAINTACVLCDITGCLQPVQVCGVEYIAGVSETLLIAPRCAVASFLTFDCSNATGRGIAEIAMELTSANSLFYPFVSRAEGGDMVISGQRNDVNLMERSNSLSGSYFGYTAESSCRIIELTNADKLMAIQCMNDGSIIVLGVDGSLVLDNYTFTASTGILEMNFLNDVRAGIPYHLNSQLAAVPTYADNDAQIAAIAFTCP